MLQRFLPMLMRYPYAGSYVWAQFASFCHTSLLLCARGTSPVYHHSKNIHTFSWRVCALILEVRNPYSQLPPVKPYNIPWPFMSLASFSAIRSCSMAFTNLDLLASTTRTNFSVLTDMRSMITNSLQPLHWLVRSLSLLPASGYYVCSTILPYTPPSVPSASYLAPAPPRYSTCLTGFAVFRYWNILKLNLFSVAEAHILEYETFHIGFAFRLCSHRLSYFHALPARNRVFD